MTQILQQPYNMFALQKQAGYPNANTPETGQTKAGEANIVHSTPIIDPTTPVVEQKPAPVVQNTQNQKSQPTLNADSSTAGMDYLNSLYTSPHEEERLRKASVMNQRILAIGDALRHIGNIANTVNYAPSQQFNNPALEAEARYEKGKALRDRANQQYYTYQQQKAAQDAKAKQWEREYALKAADAAGREALRQSQIERQGTLAALDKARADGAITENEYKKLRNEWFPKVQQATIRQKDASASASRIRAANDTKRTSAYVESKRNGGGRGSSPYTFPTKNGYISLGRDLNSNAIGKKGLYNEMKRAGIIDDVWVKKFDSSDYTPEEKSALLNTAISQWLMTDNNAAGYMKKHFGAEIVNPLGGGMNLGLEDDEEDEMDLGLE